MSIQSCGQSRDGGTFATKPLALTIRDTCDAIGLGPTSVYALIKEGKIKTKKIGRRTLVLYSSLEALVA